MVYKIRPYSTREWRNWVLKRALTLWMIAFAAMLAVMATCSYADSPLISPKGAMIGAALLFVVIWLIIRAVSRNEPIEYFITVTEQGVLIEIPETERRIFIPWADFLKAVRRSNTLFLFINRPARVLLIHLAGLSAERAEELTSFAASHIGKSSRPMPPPQSLRSAQPIPWSASPEQAKTAAMATRQNLPVFLRCFSWIIICCFLAAAVYILRLDSYWNIGFILSLIIALIFSIKKTRPNKKAIEGLSIPRLLHITGDALLYEQPGGGWTTTSVSRIHSAIALPNGVMYCAKPWSAIVADFPHPALPTPRQGYSLRGRRILLALLWLSAIACMPWAFRNSRGHLLAQACESPTAAHVRALEKKIFGEACLTNPDARCYVQDCGDFYTFTIRNPGDDDYILNITKDASDWHIDDIPEPDYLDLLLPGLKEEIFPAFEE